MATYIYPKIDIYNSKSWPNFLKIEDAFFTEVDFKIAMTYKNRKFAKKWVLNCLL